MKTSKKIFQIVIVLLTAILIKSCETINEDIDFEMTRLENQYSLKRISKKPKKVKPLYFKNSSDLEFFLKESSLNNKKQFFGEFTKKKQLFGKSTNEATIRLVNNKLDTYRYSLKVANPEHDTMEGNPSYWWFQHLEINIYWDKIGDDKSINMNSQMQGFTFSVGYTQDGYTASWDEDGKIKFHIDGTEEVYVILEGIGHVYSSPIDIDGTYDPATGNYTLTMVN